MPVKSHWMVMAVMVWGTLAWFPMSGRVSQAADPSAATIERHEIDALRRQAELLHSAVHSTLQVVHHRLYKEDEGLPLPAAVLKETFRDLEQQQGIRLRWLAIEGRAMNTEHEPKDEFQKAAAEALKRGDKAYESIEGAWYRHAGAITLTAHCLKCHVPDRKSLEDRTAGLIIEIPIKANHRE